MCLVYNTAFCCKNVLSFQKGFCVSLFLFDFPETCCHRLFVSGSLQRISIVIVLAYSASRLRDTLYQYCLCHVQQIAFVYIFQLFLKFLSLSCWKYSCSSDQSVLPDYFFNYYSGCFTPKQIILLTVDIVDLTIGLSFISATLFKMEIILKLLLLKNIM